MPLSRTQINRSKITLLLKNTTSSRFKLRNSCSHMNAAMFFPFFLGGGVISSTLLLWIFVNVNVYKFKIPLRGLRAEISKSGVNKNNT